MKQTPQNKAIEERMKPGRITMHGFLGRDTRHVGDILAADDATVKRLGYSHAAIAKRMEYFRGLGMAGLGDFIPVAPCFQVQVTTVRGKLPCPFGHPGLYGKTNITVQNDELGESITYTKLNIHFIQAHGFYEGKGAAFRLEPKDLVRILLVDKEEDIEKTIMEGIDG